MGIFPTENKECKIIFKQNRLQFQDKTYGKALVNNKLHFSLEKVNIPKLKINLKILNLI